jgi:hypothetical protein
MILFSRAISFCFALFGNRRPAPRARVLTITRAAPPTRAMSARTGWKRDAEGRMLRSLSCEVIMSDEQPSMLLDKVPAHVLREVFGFLGDPDLASAEATCATFRQAARSESLWRKQLANKLGDQANIVLPEKLPYERFVLAPGVPRERPNLVLFSFDTPSRAARFPLAPR